MDDHEVTEGLAKLVQYSAGVLAILTLAVVIIAAMTSCAAPCKTVYYRDSLRPRPYYRMDYCPGKDPTVKCDSPNRLPNHDCR